MFNDPLTIPDCTALIGELRKTHNPFECAHGRPSVVPLGGLPNFGADSQGNIINEDGTFDLLNFDLKSTIDIDWSVMLNRLANKYLV